MKIIKLFALATLAIFAMGGLALKVCAQDVVQDDGPKGYIHVQLPDNGLMIQGSDGVPVEYKGIVNVSISPISPRLIKKYGTGAMFTDEFNSGSGGECGWREPKLPAGVYEVDFSMRDGDNLKTCVKNPIVVNPDERVKVNADFSNAKTLVIGGDVTFQMMENVVAALALEVKDLKAQVAVLEAAKASGTAPAAMHPSAGAQ